jgi:hypothetical protein
LEKVFAFKHIYPDLHLILKQWDTQRTISPHFVQNGERFDVNLVSLIVSMSPRNDMELRDLAATVVIILLDLGLSVYTKQLLTTGSSVLLIQLLLDIGN